VQMSRSLPLPVPYSSIHYVRLATACLVLAVFSTVHFSGCNESEVRPQNKCRTGSGSDRIQRSLNTTSQVPSKTRPNLFVDSHIRTPHKSARPDLVSIKLHALRGLLFSDPARDDVRLEIIFAADRYTCQASQQCDLSDMCKRVGNRTLKDFLGRISERRR
jgi:hypothetical protein